jgi:hypothetical protein
VRRRPAAASMPGEEQVLQWQILFESMRGKFLPRRDRTHKSINGLHKFRI